jgi:hypothetical protein
VYWADTPTGGHVSLVYPPREGLPSSQFTHAGLLITEFQGSVDQDSVQKTGFPGTEIRSVTVNGAPGFWISGQAHEIAFLDANGRPFFESVHLAGNTLVWSRGEVTLRLECHCSEAQALRIAEAMR